MHKRLFSTYLCTFFLSINNSLDNTSYHYRKISSVSLVHLNSIILYDVVQHTSLLVLLLPFTHIK